MRTGVILIFIFLSCSLNGQIYFNKSIEDGQLNGLGSVELVDTLYYCDGLSYNGNFSKKKIYCLDKNGDTVFTRQYGIDSSLYPITVAHSLIYLNNKIYSIGSRFTPTESVVYIWAFSLNGDSLWCKELQPYDSSVVQQIKWDGGKHFILDGAIVTPSGDLQMMMIKTDTLGNIIWEKEFGGSQEENGYSIDTTADGGYIFSGYTYTYGNGGGTHDVYVVKTDSAGNFQWHKWFGSNQNDAGWVKSLPNGQYFIYGGIYINGFTGQKAFIRKINAAGNLIWHKNFTNYASPSIEVFNTFSITSDGGGYLAGVLVDNGINSNNPVGYVVRVDSSGNEGFHRIYTLSQNDNYINDLALTPDGGFVCSGYLFPDGVGITTQDGWIFKADSMGCLVQNCWLEIDDLRVSDSELQIYPNPNNGEFTIEFPEEINEPHQIEIIDVTGKRVFTTAVTKNLYHLNVNCPSGLYIIRIYNEDYSFEKRMVIN